MFITEMAVVANPLRLTMLAPYEMLCVYNSCSSL